MLVLRSAENTDLCDCVYGCQPNQPVPGCENYWRAASLPEKKQPMNSPDAFGKCVSSLEAPIHTHNCLQKSTPISSHTSRHPEKTLPRHSTDCSRPPPTSLVPQCFARPLSNLDSEAYYLLAFIAAFGFL